MLRISKDLKLPLDVVTATQAILARKGAGKSYTASVFAEELLKARQQIVVADPTGAWWGLRAAADGKGPGHAIAVFGGEHGDIPLEERAGELVAQSIVQDRFSAILDLSGFRKGQLHRFMADFLETLYRLNRDALHLFVDEADVVAPQKVYGGEENRTLGAMQDVVRRGRIKGIGCTLISQRPQVISKDVLTQCETLITLRMSHPRDIAAIGEWIAVHGDEDTAAEMIESLPALPTGDAWFWAPSADIFRRIHVRARETFDSGATPKAGERVRAPKNLAEVDVKKLGAAIAETAERAKANDPKALKAELARLRAELERAQKVKAPPAKEKRVEVPVFRPGEVERMEKLHARLGEVLAAVRAPRPTTAAAPARPVPPAAPPRPRPTQRAVADVDGEAKLAGGERKILTVLAQYPAGRTKRQVALLTGYAINGGGFNNYLAALRSRSLIVGSEQLQITDAGVDALGPYDPLPTGAALREQWMTQLGKAERSVLEALTAAYPDAMTKEDVAAAAGYAPDGGGFNNALSRLRTLELISGRGELKASDELFEAQP